MDDQVTRKRALDKARRRVEEAAPFSPEWDAAVQALEELETAADAESKADSPRPETP